MGKEVAARVGAVGDIWAQLGCGVRAAEGRNLQGASGMVCIGEWQAPTATDVHHESGSDLAHGGLRAEREGRYHEYLAERRRGLLRVRTLPGTRCARRARV